MASSFFGVDSIEAGWKGIAARAWQYLSCEEGSLKDVAFQVQKCITLLLQCNHPEVPALAREARKMHMWRDASSDQLPVPRKMPRSRSSLALYKADRI